MYCTHTEFEIFRTSPLPNTREGFFIVTGVKNRDVVKKVEEVVIRKKKRKMRGWGRNESVMNNGEHKSEKKVFVKLERFFFEMEEQKLMQG